MLMVMIATTTTTVVALVAMNTTVMAVIASGVNKNKLRHIQKENVEYAMKWNATKRTLEKP